MSTYPVVSVYKKEFDQNYWDKLNDFTWVILAEGDSWFSYGSQRFRNLLLELELPERALILNIAEPGDTLRRMHDTVKNPEFYFQLFNRGGRRWDAIFLSGGGNDIIDAAWDDAIKAPHIFVRPADPASITLANLREVVVEQNYKALFDYLATSVRQIVEEGRDARDGNSSNVPLFMHTYALMQPRNAPAQFVTLKIGPWLYRTCRWLGIDQTLWIDVARMVLTDLAKGLKGLDLPNFYVIDTLALTTSMVPADAGSTGNSNDWENEIHPNQGGYRKLAATWSTEIPQIIGARR